MARKKRKPQQRKQPKDRGEFPPFDPRIMEAAMGRLFAARQDEEGTPLARARELVYEAFEAKDPRERERLAREALSISEDCADAWLLLAEQSRTPQEALPLYERAVAAGRREIGDEFDELAEERLFWGVLETRPFMRANMGLAECLWALGRQEAAAEQYREMLRLNPDDNQGVRHLLAVLLFLLGRDQELKQLLEQYAEDATANWAYSKPLLAFRMQRDSEQARRLLNEAKQANPHVPAYLLGHKMMPRELPAYVGFGTEDEAISYVANFLPAWKGTPGAIPWLRKVLKEPVALPSQQSPVQFREVRSDLARLPQAEGEVWQVDVHRLPQSVQVAGRQARPWVVLISRPSENDVQMVQLAQKKPTIAEVRERLVEAMLEPPLGDPHRPERVEVRLKGYWKAWRSELEKVGVECALCDELEHLDRIFDQTAGQLLSMSGRDAAAGEEIDPAELPQDDDEVWQADVVRAPTWIEHEGQMQQPWITLVASRSEGLVLGHDMAVESPSPEAFAAGVLQAMRSPLVGPPRRPGEVQVRSEDHRITLGPFLKHLDVACTVRDDLDQLDDMLDSLFRSLGDAPPVPALVEGPGVTREQAGSSYEAAARFYQSAPWRRVPGDTVIRIDSDRLRGGPWYAVVMGQSGMTLGLALYTDLAMLRTILTGEMSDEESAGLTSGMSVIFGEEFSVAFADLEAAEQFGWPVAAPEAWPSVLVIEPGHEFRGPNAQELQLLEGCLRAIPEFLTQDRESLDVTIPLASGTLPLKMAWQNS